LFEKYKNEGLIITMSSGVNIIDDYVVIIISATCNDGNKFIETIEKDIKHLSLNKTTFERKKKLFLKSYILDFDNIEVVEYNICESIIMDNKVNYNEYSYINNMNFEEANRILKLLTFDNTCIIKTIK
jgi:hypothetical protein